MTGYGSSPYGSYVYSSGGEYSDSSVGFTVSVQVAPTLSTVPKVKRVFNEFDEHALLVGITRLSGETNSSLRRRTLDSFAFRANSTYQGMVHAITRELGLSLFQPITVRAKMNLDGTLVATDPYIYFDGANLYLYEDYANRTLDIKMDRFEPGGNFEHLGDLTSGINDFSTYFEAWLNHLDYRYYRSMNVLNQSNRGRKQEAIEATTKFRLGQSYLVDGSIYFSNREVFKTEVASSALVTSPGSFWIDYTNGIVKCYSMPDQGTSVTFDYHNHPWKPWASEVILHDINQDSFKIKMFNQILDEHGSSVHGIPTELGVDIINELLGVTPMYWGV